MTSNQVQESPQLLRFPTEGLAGGCGAWSGWLRPLGNIDGNNLGIDGVGERLMQDRVDVADGLWAEPTVPHLVATCQKASVEAVQHRRCELPELLTAML